MTMTKALPEHHQEGAGLSPASVAYANRRRQMIATNDCHETSFGPPTNDDCKLAKCVNKNWCQSASQRVGGQQDEMALNTVCNCNNNKQTPPTKTTIGPIEAKVSGWPRRMVAAVGGCDLGGYSNRRNEECSLGQQVDRCLANCDPRLAAGKRKRQCCCHLAANCWLDCQRPQQLGHQIGSDSREFKVSMRRKNLAKSDERLQLLIAIACVVQLVLIGHPMMVSSARTSENHTQLEWRPPVRVEARKALQLLQYFVRPLIKNYFALEAKLPKGDGAGSSQLMGKLIGPPSPAAGSASDMDQLEQELRQLDQWIEKFFEQGVIILGQKEFCVYSVITDARDFLKPLAEKAKLLSIVYDLILIEFHESCVTSTISRLPQVPYLVRDVVKIYMDGAEKRLPDLNGDPQAFFEDTEEEPFDVDRAMQRSGSLAQVVNLLLTMPDGLNTSDRVRAFKGNCKRFLIDIEKEWQSLHIMNELLANETNSIRRTNNWILRRLTPTKYSDICSQLSAKSDDSGEFIMKKATDEVL